MGLIKEKSPLTPQLKFLLHIKSEIQVKHTHTSMCHLTNTLMLPCPLIVKAVNMLPRRCPDSRVLRNSVTCQKPKAIDLISGSMPVDGIPVESAAFLFLPLKDPCSKACQRKGGSITHNTNHSIISTIKHL
jgi:hypothetical protein